MASSLRDHGPLCQNKSCMTMEMKLTGQAAHRHLPARRKTTFNDVGSAAQVNRYKANEHCSGQSVLQFDRSVVTEKKLLSPFTLYVQLANHHHGHHLPGRSLGHLTGHKQRASHT